MPLQTSRTLVPQLVYNCRHATDDAPSCPLLSCAGVWWTPLYKGDAVTPNSSVCARYMVIALEQSEAATSGALWQRGRLGGAAHRLQKRATSASCPSDICTNSRRASSCMRWSRTITLLCYNTNAKAALVLRQTRAEYTMDEQQAAEALTSPKHTEPGLRMEQQLPW